MKSFLSGHSGMVGKHLRERLEGNKYLFNRGQDPRVAIEYQPDVIFHLAGEIYNDKKMIESNILLTHQLLEASRHIPHLKAFIYIGSSSEYGRKDHPMREIDYLDPATMYEATKGAGTLLCQAYARSYNVPTMVARPFSLYGKYEPSHRFIPTIIRSIKKDIRINIAPGVHDFIHIDDFIDGLLLLAKKPQVGEIYNFGSEKQTTNAELVKLIEKLMKKTTKHTEIDPLHSYDSDCWVADCTKAKKLGWKPKISLIEGLTQVISATTSKGTHVFGK